MIDRFMFRIWNPVKKEWVFRNFNEGIEKDNFAPEKETV